MGWLVGKWLGGIDRKVCIEGAYIREDGERRGRDVLIGSLAKHGIAALVPSRSFTFTIIIGWLVGAIVGAAFFFFSFLGISADRSSLFVGGGGERGRGRSRSR